MRIWFREWKDTHLLRDYTYENYDEDTRTHKIWKAIDSACEKLDLAHPIWLDSNIKDFKRNADVRFRSDSFQEDIPFDYLEMTVIEEDY